MDFLDTEYQDVGLDQERFHRQRLLQKERRKAKSCVSIYYCVKHW